MSVEGTLKPRDELIHFASLADTLEDAVLCLRPDGQILHHNPSLAGLLGYGPTELVGESIKKVLAAPDYDLYFVVVENVLAESVGARKSLRTTLIPKSGSGIPVEMQLMVSTMGVDKLLTAIVGGTKTGRRAKHIRQGETIYRSLFDSLPGAMVLMDLGLRIVMCNQRAADVLGFTGVADAAGKPFAHFVVQDDRERFEGDLRNITKTQGMHNGYEMVLAGFAQLRVDLSVSLALRADGTPKGYIALVQDPTNASLDDIPDEGDKFKGALMGTVGAVLSLVKLKDPYVADHQERVTKLACAIGRVMELSESVIDGLNVAGLVHDVGKLMTPMQILSKPGKLTAEEFEIVKKHIFTGQDIIGAIEFPWPVAKAVVQHHERLNGSGYPAGVKGKDIILESRILAVADVIEAMSSRRPYRAGLGIERALQEVTSKSEQFDKTVAEACRVLFEDQGWNFL